MLTDRRQQKGQLLAESGSQHLFVVTFRLCSESRNSELRDTGLAELFPGVAEVVSRQLNARWDQGRSHGEGEHTLTVSASEMRNTSAATPSTPSKMFIALLLSPGRSTLRLAIFS